MERVIWNRSFCGPGTKETIHYKERKIPSLIKYIHGKFNYHYVYKYYKCKNHFLFFVKGHLNINVPGAQS